MSHDDRQLDPLESALAELGDAVRAGVFARTPAKRAWLLAPATSDKSEPVPIWVHMSRRVRWLSVAATVGLAVGVGSWMFHGQLSSLRDQAIATALLEKAPPPASEQFFTCLNGPQGADLADCRGSDFDADGDVDLADFRAYQVAYASAR